MWNENFVEKIKRAKTKDELKILEIYLLKIKKDFCLSVWIKTISMSITARLMRRSME